MHYQVVWVYRFIKDTKQYFKASVGILAWVKVWMKLPKIGVNRYSNNKFQNLQYILLVVPYNAKCCKWEMEGALVGICQQIVALIKYITQINKHT